MYSPKFEEQSWLQISMAIFLVNLVEGWNWASIYQKHKSYIVKGSFVFNCPCIYCAVIISLVCNMEELKGYIHPVVYVELKMTFPRVITTSPCGHWLGVGSRHWRIHGGT